METPNTLNIQTAPPSFDWNLFRRDVKRDVRNCVLFLFFYFAVNLIAAGIVMLNAMVKSQTYLAMVADSSFITDALAGNLSDKNRQLLIDLTAEIMTPNNLVIMSIAGIVVGGCVFIFYRKKRFFTDLAMPAAEPMTARIFIILVIITQTIQYVYGLIAAFVDSLMPSGVSLEESYAAAVDSMMTPIGVLYIVIIGPIFEELIFRGAVLGSLRKFGNNFAIIISTLIFGFYHVIIIQIPFAFILGLLLGYVAVRWSLRASIALHMVVNGLSTLMSNADVNNMGLMASIGFFAFACIIATIVLGIKYRRQLADRIRAGAPYYAHTYSAALSSIPLWVFLFITTSIGLLQVGI